MTRARKVQSGTITPAIVSDRERFMAVVGNGPLLYGDAIVLLAGEDAEPRLSTVFALLKGSAGSPKPPMAVLTGGLHDLPQKQGAWYLKPLLINKGIDPTRILVDAEAKNTHEQAVNVIAIAKEREWTRLLVVASAYHQYRAFLTFLRVLQDENLDRTMRLINIPASHTPWSEKPDGLEATRLELLDLELGKIDQYPDHVASYADGLEHLIYWERK